MADFIYGVGMPAFDWLAIVESALDQGTFQPGGTAARQTLAFGQASLILVGSGFSVSGPRDLAAGMITGLVLRQGATTVFSSNGFSALTAADLQSVLDAYDGGTPNFRAVVVPALFGEQMNFVGSSGGDIIHGGAFNDVIRGNGGDNTLYGGGGNDVLYGGPGVNQLDGGLGDDTYFVDDENDSIVDSGGFDTLSASFTLFMSESRYSQQIERGVLRGTGDFWIVGNESDNWLYGNSGDNLLSGGGDGGDRLFGGLGDDTYQVAVGDFISDSGGIDRIINSIGSDLRDYVGVENVECNINDIPVKVTGNQLDNRLLGNRNINNLFGEQGDDTLIGGLGRDTFRGDSGNDVFDFNAVAETGTTVWTRDAIADFTPGDDKIDLATIDANGGLSGDAAFTFIGQTPFTSGGGRLRYFQEDNVNNALDRTIVEADIDGNAVADFQIGLNGLIALAAADFVL